MINKTNFAKLFFLLTATFGLSAQSGGFERGNLKVDVIEDFQLGQRALSSGDSIDARLGQVKAGNEYYVLEDLAGNSARLPKNSRLMHADITRGLPVDHSMELVVDSRELLDESSRIDSDLRGGCAAETEVTSSNFEVEGRILKSNRVVATFTGSSTQVKSRSLPADCRGR